MKRPPSLVPRLIAESIVIVLSILLAFTVDALWDGRSDRLRHQDNLRALENELGQVVSRIDASSTQLLRSLSAVEGLLALTGPGPAELFPSDSMIILVRRAMSLSTLELPTGAVDFILATGDVRMMDSDSLGSVLMTWPALVLDVREGFEWMREERDKVWEPIVAEYVPLKDVLGRSAILGASRHSVDMAGLLSDPRFEARLAERFHSGSSTLQILEALKETAERLLRAINREEVSDL